MPSPKLTSLALTSALVNSLNVKEQLQRVSIGGDNTTVDARGIADRYVNKQTTKQKQTVEMTYFWYNSSTGQEASNLDVSLYTLGGVSYWGELKSCTMDFTNAGPEASALGEGYEYPQPTSTDATITSELLIISSAVWTVNILTDTAVQMSVLVSITFAGENIQIPGILKSSKVSVVRGEVQMEDVMIELQGTPTTPGDTTSLIYSFLVGSALVPFSYALGSGSFSSASAVMTKMGIRIADKALIEQTLTLEVQGAMTA